jgi:hypothetical protein
LEGADKKASDEENIVPTLRLQNVNEAAIDVPSAQQKQDDDEQVGKFMMDLGGYLQEQSQRFKVTVKKKYINDILM